MIVSQPTAINDDLYHGWLVKEVLERIGDIGALSQDHLIEFLERWSRLHDEFVMRQGTRKRFEDRELTPTEYASSLFANGMRSADVRRLVHERYGVEITKSNASHIRRRTINRMAAASC